MFFCRKGIWSSCFLFITEWLNKDTSGETTSWIVVACSMVCWGWFVYLWCIATSSWSSTSRCRYIFWWHMFFNNSLYIAFTWNINQFLLLNTFSFLFSQMFLLVNSTFLYFHPWTLNLLQSQPAITCSKLTIETLELDVKYTQS